MLEIVRRGSKFYLQDPETGEIAGEETGYPTEIAARKALKTLSAARTLSKIPSGQLEPAPTQALTGSARPGLQAIMASIRKKGEI